MLNLNLQISYYNLLITISKTIVDAENYANIAMNINPVNFDSLVTLAVRYFVEDQEKKALDIFNNVAQAVPSHPYAK